MDDDTRTGTQLIGALLRWQESGGVWRVRDRTPQQVTVALLRCDAGEVVDHISSTDPAWLTYLRDRDGSDPS